MKAALFILAFLALFGLATGAHASGALSINPAAGFNGLFEINTTDPYILLAPSGGGDVSGMFCTSSSTPDYYDCDVHTSSFFGSWNIVDTADNSGVVYNYQTGTSTADTLLQATYLTFATLVNNSINLWLGFAGILFALFAAILIALAFKSAIDRGRGR